MILRRAPNRLLVAALATIAMAAAGGWGCASLRTGNKGAGDHAAQTAVAAKAIVDPPRRAGAPLLFVAMPMAPAFEEARQALVAEVSGTFDVTTFVVTQETRAADFHRALDAAAPVCVVLMNNGTVRMYRDYQRERAGATFPAAVIVMTSFLEDIRREIKRATGIAYEVPGVTAFVSLRSLVEAPVTRVGVVHSPYARAFVGRQRALASKEQFELISIELPAEAPTARDLQGALDALKRYHKIDVLWVLNDNRLLRDGRFLREAWMPALRSLGVPVVVGAAPLVNPSSPFGTFAVLPDHAALGAQTANMIFDLADNNWRTEDHRIELPLSTVKVLDVRSAKGFGLREKALNEVDRPLE
jgi:putative ABC transport system substrate-binding protein